MKKLIISAVIWGMTAGLSLADGHSVIRMGTEGAYPPWNFVDDNGEIAGFERELGDELCKRAELKCEWVKNDWDSIIPNLVSGNYDTIIAGMSITDARKEKIDFTTNYVMSDPSYYLAASEDANWQTGVIAAQSNTIQAAYIAETGATLVEFATPEETISAVRNGEADAVLADSSNLKPIADEDPGLMFVGDKPIIGGGVGMGIRKSDTDLRNKFTAAIDSMKGDGTLNALITKHGISEQLF